EGSDQVISCSLLDEAEVLAHEAHVAQSERRCLRPRLLQGTFTEVIAGESAMGIRVPQSVRRMPFATTDVKHIDPRLQSVHDVWHEWDDGGHQGALERLLVDTGPERHEVLELVVKDSAPAAETVDNPGFNR